MGRTGTLHAWEQESVVPDLQTVAKGLGAGYEAIGALLVGKKVVNVLSKGTKAFVHFQTYHGHPLSCAAAYEVQQVIKDEDLVTNCRDVGEYLGQILKDRLAAHKNVGNIRGRGMLWGVSLYDASVINILFKREYSADALPSRLKSSKTEPPKHLFRSPTK
jgi:adenosylmethionine-8-amino-7-oxononanoate aminotransferase